MPPCNDKFWSLREEEMRQVYCPQGALKFVNSLFVHTYTAVGLEVGEPGQFQSLLENPCTPLEKPFMWL
jgi:hypothetical protein